MPKSKYLIPLTFDSFALEEKKAVNEVMQSGFYSMGQNVALFEKKLAKWLGVKNAIMVNSGSSANLLLVYSLLYSYKSRSLLQPGDEVLVPALLWPTTIWPIMQFGLKPILVDIDNETLAINLNDAAKKITKKTKAIFLIHVLGYAADMKAVNQFVKKNKLLLLEDCCESFGSFYNKKSVGTFGLGGTFSHFFSHHLTTIEGGSIITNDDDIANDIRSFRAHGWIRDRSDKDLIIKKDKQSKLDPRWHFILPGFNLRPSEIQGALGLVQLKKANQFLRLRENFLSILEGHVNKISWMDIIGAKQIRKSSKLNRRHSWMNVPFILHDDSPLSVRELTQIFEKYSIETRPIITGNFLYHPASKYLKVKNTNFPNTDRVHNQGFMIGSFVEVAPAVSAALKNLFQFLEKL